MKHKGCTTYLSDERDEDLYRQYNIIMDRYGWMVPMREVYEELTKVPAKRFYVTPTRCVEALRTLNCGCANQYPERKAMYTEIMSRAKAMMKKRGCTLMQAVRVVVEQRAPSFYLSVRSIKSIITKKNKR